MKLFGSLSVFDGEMESGDTALKISSDLYDVLLKIIQGGEYGGRFTCGVSRRGRWFQLDYEISEKIVGELFRMIRKVDGRVPSLSVAKVPSDGTFFQPLKQKYSNREIEDFKYFTFFPNQFIGTMGARKSINDPISLIDDSRLRKKLAIGEIYPHRVCGVDGNMVSILTDLKGGNFRKIDLDKPGGFSGVYHLCSDVILPECLLEKLDAFGARYIDDGKGCLFEGGPFTVPELVYEVDLFPGFDIALTKEYIGLSEIDRFQILVISREVRSRFKKCGLNRNNYYPVRCISPGEPLFADPWKRVLLS